MVISPPNKIRKINLRLFLGILREKKMIKKLEVFFLCKKRWLNEFLLASILPFLTLYNYFEYENISLY